MARRWTVTVLGVILAITLVAAIPAAADDRPPVVRNVLVPGESGALPPGTHSIDQIPLYDGLTSKFDQVSPDDVNRYFKDEKLGDTSGTPEASPRPGLKILRDSYDVPHIFGQTRFDTEFGAGWVTAEDRGLLLE
ncbi:MAG TPA: penicillin acylase family protein, partial [Acidimicrobiia bacterium]|nr:penicillin acylase family protein [Acidimicrobiia bacterium]